MQLGWCSNWLNSLSVAVSVDSYPRRSCWIHPVSSVGYTLLREALDFRCNVSQVFTCSSVFCPGWSAGGLDWGHVAAVGLPRTLWAFELLNRWNTLDIVLDGLGLRRQERQYAAVRSMSAVRLHSSSAKVWPGFTKYMSFAYMKFRPAVTGKSFVWRLRRAWDRTNPCGLGLPQAVTWGFALTKHKCLHKAVSSLWFLPCPLLCCRSHSR